MISVWDNQLCTAWKVTTSAKDHVNGIIYSIIPCIESASWSEIKVLWRNNHACARLGFPKWCSRSGWSNSYFQQTRWNS